jgi:hypothetical protein
MNPNYAIMVKQDLDKLSTIAFIAPMGEATWLSSIVVVTKKNSKFWICVDFSNLNIATKKDPYPLFFIEEVLNMVAGHEMYYFLDGFSNYHQIMIALEDRYKTTFIIDWGLSFMSSCHLAYKTPHPFIKE